MIGSLWTMLRSHCKDAENMPNYAETVSTLAFGASLVSLSWQVIRARHENPTISVHLGVNHMLKQNGERGYAIRVTVTNAGGRAVTLGELDWQYTEMGYARESFSDGDDESITGPPLPHRLGSFDILNGSLPAHSWTQSWTAPNRPAPSLATSPLGSARVGCKS
jgi:hypothetical protein